jgi:selenide, water dikinase
MIYIYAINRPPLLANLRRHIQQQFPLQSWEPQSEFLSIIGTSDGSAICSKAGIAIRGEYLWKLKDRIDREFMSNFSELPVMSIDNNSSKTTASSSVQQLAGPVITDQAAALIQKAKMRYISL